MYAGLGAAGVPWSRVGGGHSLYVRPYRRLHHGFILAALFLGYMTDRFVKARRFLPMLGLMLFSSFVLIYGRLAAA